MKKKTKENSIMLRGFGIFVAIAAGLIIVLTMTIMISKAVFDMNSLPELATPTVSEGMRGELGIDKNINESTIDNYLNRSDSVYRDVRMLVDPADYEKIGGDKYLSGIISGFEVVPLPYLIEPEGLPEAVGKSYKGKTLFSRLANNKIGANYAESKQILEDLFPKDKNIFLMCGGGGYAGMTKRLLVELGWDENKIWNVGGFWYYEGKNKIDIKLDDGTFAFWRLKYHNIDFDSLTEL
jgi:rhodanese-related sulfurtransferase